MRAAEGARLEAVLRRASRRDDIARRRRRGERGGTARAIQARLRALVATLLDASPALPEERLAQEAALLVARAISARSSTAGGPSRAARDLLGEGVAIGRRLDFLCRSSTARPTRCGSKSADVELTRIGLALKVADRA